MSQSQHRPNVALFYLSKSVVTSFVKQNNIQQNSLSLCVYTVYRMKKINPTLHMKLELHINLVSKKTHYHQIHLCYFSSC